MILNQDNEYAALLDACVLVPMCLCDTLLRLAEDPAMYRPLWSRDILREVGAALESKIKLSPEQCKRRIDAMVEAFPEAEIATPGCLGESLDGIPDKDDRHVLASAIAGHAHVIVTNNLKDFPLEYLAQFDILCQSADDFLVHQFHLNGSLVLEKLDGQAINIQRQREDILTSLKQLAPQFSSLVQNSL
jgi:predicted nucleic acid-binding protein